MKTLLAVGLILVGLVLGVGLFAGTRNGEWCWDCALFRDPYRGRSTSFKTIASAQADFRGNDRDGNGRQDYWRSDISGLYAVVPKGSQEPIKLIELSVAGADDAPVTPISEHTIRRPKGGFWYRTLRHADEDPGKPDPNRFAACMYPADHHAARSVFVISEDTMIYRRPWKGPGDVPSVYPDPATLRREWLKCD